MGDEPDDLTKLAWRLAMYYRRFRRLEALDAPAIIMRNERDLLERAYCAFATAYDAEMAKDDDAEA